MPTVTGIVVKAGRSGPKTSSLHVQKGDLIHIKEMKLNGSQFPKHKGVNGKKKEYTKGTVKGHDVAVKRMKKRYLRKKKGVLEKDIDKSTELRRAVTAYNHWKIKSVIGAVVKVQGGRLHGQYLVVEPHVHNFKRFDTEKHEPLLYGLTVCSAKVYQQKHGKPGVVCDYQGGVHNNIFTVTDPEVSTGANYHKHMAAAAAAAAGQQRCSPAGMNGAFSWRRFRIVPKGDPSKALDCLWAGKANGTAVGLFNKNGTGAQRFRFEDKGNNWCAIIPCHTNDKVLDVNEGKGPPVQLWANYNKHNQMFHFMPAGDNYFHIIPSSMRNKCLDISGTNGHIIVWDRHGSDNQKFAFEPLN